MSRAAISITYQCNSCLRGCSRLIKSVSCERASDNRKIQNRVNVNSSHVMALKTIKGPQKLSGPLRSVSRVPDPTLTCILKERYLKMSKHVRDKELK